ncbi:hypothetical protein QR680_010290 [Steinernema hermaphroditum]|uniref:ShKT domain-containing protein n=1 Tax=Steinernema hermaphroditum TaxID=289476 RepID=A0AA39IPW3_9BILA|nr:hypothetical protein QR680_010290 [Steinernema hermaphroditum]
MIAFFVILLISSASIQAQGIPCVGNNCPAGYTCDIASQECVKNGASGSGSESESGVGSSNCVDNFRGQGNCAQFKIKGFCGDPRKDFVRKWCAKTCDLC